MHLLFRCIVDAHHYYIRGSYQANASLRGDTLLHISPVPHRLVLTSCSRNMQWWSAISDFTRRCVLSALRQMIATFSALLRLCPAVLLPHYDQLFSFIQLRASLQFVYASSDISSANSATSLTESDFQFERMNRPPKQSFALFAIKSVPAVVRGKSRSAGICRLARLPLAWILPVERRSLNAADVGIRAASA